MTLSGDETGQYQAAEAHSSHERSEQHCERDGCRTDYQFQKLEPDNLIDKRRNSASERKQEHERELGQMELTSSQRPALPCGSLPGCLSSRSSPRDKQNRRSCGGHWGPFPSR